MSLPSGQSQADDPKSHYTAIVLGAGVSGLATAIQLKQQLDLDDVLVYEKSDQIGGTWNYNRYPGAGCDIPFSLYSFSFAPPKPPYIEWNGQAGILAYLLNVQKQFNMRNIRFQTKVTSARFSAEDGLWHLSVENVASGQSYERTCNLLFSCLGGLAIPNDAPFDKAQFNGSVFHSTEWDHSVSLKDKKVVIVGNGCTAAQVVPAIVGEVASVTQIARSKQCFLRRPTRLPLWIEWSLRCIPGFNWLFRAMLFWGLESAFVMSDIEHGVKKRKEFYDAATSYAKKHAPPEYVDALTPDSFIISQKRRVIDCGYVPALKDPKITLIQDDAIVAAKGDTVTTKAGKEFEADIVVLCTGFKVREYLYPLKIENAKGEILIDRLRSNGSKLYRGTFVSNFPNFFWIMGPNTATGHSSVIFTSECQINLAIATAKPILRALQSSRANSSPIAPTVAVTTEAEDNYYALLRKEMKKKVWELDGGKSWYVDEKDRICTTLYPWSQVNFWWHSLWPVKSHFRYENV